MWGGAHESWEGEERGGCGVVVCSQCERDRKGEFVQVVGRGTIDWAKRRYARKRGTEEYLHCTRKVWNSYLKMKSKVAVHNSRCVGAHRYLGGVLNWRRSGEKLDVATRRILKACKAHHKGSAVERLYIQAIIMHHCC